MAVYRIHSSKSNTIASGIFQSLNSGQNAVSDLWYGGGGTTTSPIKRNSISRLMLYFDLTDLQGKINSKEINQDLISEYNLRLKNSIPSDKVLEQEYEFDELYKKISASFDLVCFPINKDWDQGRGYDLIDEKFLVKQYGNNLVSGTSNWASATTVVSWDEPGIYANPTASTSFYATQHFDIGNEDINMDITHIVKNWLSGGSENYGLCIAYRRDYELTSGDTRYVSSFYTENTNTAYKPYLEIVYNQSILDDRKQVCNNRPSKLFLYTFSGHSPVNIATLSAVTVDIKRSSTVVYADLVPTQLSKGVYYVNVWMSAATAGEQYSDVWKNVSFSSYDNQDVTQSFQIQKNYYTSNTPTINEYVLSIYGIENNDIIRQDENIRIFCDLRANYSTSAPNTSYSLEYQIIMNNEMEVCSWTPVNQIVLNGCKTNYFDLGANWLLHNQTYQIFFRIREMGTSRVMPEKIYFKVIKPF